MHKKTSPSIPTNARTDEVTPDDGDQPVQGRDQCTVAREVYAIPIHDRWLLVSPRTWSSAVVNRAAVYAVAEHIADGEQDASSEVCELCHTLVAHAAVPRAPAGEAKLVVIPTHACNMQCTYCDFSTVSAPATQLDPQLGCILFDEFAERARCEHPNEPIRVHFFGGEPLVARECIETIVHYARASCVRYGGTPWFEATTNGVFDETTLPFLGDYFDSLVVSLDGPASLHDGIRRRPDGGGTYACIAENIHRLAKYPLEIVIRACITNVSEDAMDDIAAHFCSEFEFEVLAFEMMSSNVHAESAGLRPPDPMKFARGFMAAEAIAARHGVQLVHGPSELVGPRTTACPLGNGTIMLMPDGHVQTCYQAAQRWLDVGLDLSIGCVDRVSGARLDYAKLGQIDAVLGRKDRCERCFCRFTCAGGCHVEQTPPGCSIEYDYRCEAIRIITAARLLRMVSGTEAMEQLLGQWDALHAINTHGDDRLSAWTFPGGPA